MAFALVFSNGGGGHSHGFDPKTTPIRDLKDRVSLELHLSITPQEKLNQIDSVSIKIFNPNGPLHDQKAYLYPDGKDYFFVAGLKKDTQYRIEWILNETSGKKHVADFDFVFSKALKAHGSHGINWYLGLTAILIAGCMGFYLGKKKNFVRPSVFVLVSGGILLLPSGTGVFAHGGGGHSHGSEEKSDTQHEDQISGEVFSGQKKVAGYTLDFHAAVFKQSPGRIWISKSYSQVLGIERQEVSESSGKIELTVQGEVKPAPDKLIEVFPLASGKIRKVFAQEGAKLKKGQALATIFSREALSVQNEITSIRVEKSKVLDQLARVKQGKSLAKNELGRVNQLVKMGALSKPPLQKAEAELSREKEDLANLSADLKNAKKSRELEKKNLERDKKLFDLGLISRRELEAVEKRVLEANNSVDKLKLRVSQTQKQLELAKKQVQIEKQKFQSGVLNKRGLEEAESKLKQLSTQTNSLMKILGDIKKKETLLKKKLKAFRFSKGSGSDYVIDSPISGEVIFRNADIGEVVDDSKLLFKILDSSKFWVVGEVFESDLERIKVGQNCTISQTGSLDKGIEGKISYIGKAIDPSKRTLPIRIEVQNTGGQLKAFQKVHIGISSDESDSVVRIPSGSIIESGKDSFVYLWSEPFYRRIKVTTGKKIGQSVEVLEGLLPGDGIALRGIEQIKSLGEGEK